MIILSSSWLYKCGPQEQLDTYYMNFLFIYIYIFFKAIIVGEVCVHGEENGYKIQSRESV